MDAQTSNLNSENRSSRQAYTIGKNAMSKMSDKIILIVGLTSIGISVAKMVIQNGAKQVILCNNGACDRITPQDFRSFFVKTEDIGKNKSDVLLNRLQKLNPYTKVIYHNDKIKPDNMNNINNMNNMNNTQYSVAIFCDMNLVKLVPYNEVCRTNGIKFISANSFGLFGGVFSDFGNQCETNNPNGVEPSTGFIVKYHKKL